MRDSGGAMRWYDAHNHLQDDRLGDSQHRLVEESAAAGVLRMVVNGSCESDWPDVARLAREFPIVLPSYGYHPWYVRERTPGWRDALIRQLDQRPGALGEIGLDRWIADPDLAAQEECFTWQLTLAAERNLPASLHCLKAWGRLEELLRAGPRPARGFLLHSYGGPPEMIPGLVRLGAFFSFPGFFLLDRKRRQRETFKQVPLDRLLVETDAPDQLPPPEHRPHPLTAPDGATPLNHPANLPAIYQALALFLGTPVEELASQVERNFLSLFGGI